MSYHSKIAAALLYDRLDGGVEASNAVVGAPSSITGPWGNAGGALSFDGTDDGAILQPRDLPRNFEVPGGFTCTGLHYDSAAGGFWVGDFTNSAAKLIDPDDFSVLDTIALGFAPQGIVATSTDLWVADFTGQSLRKFSKSTGTEDTGAEISLSISPTGVTLNGSGNLLVIAYAAGTNNLLEYTTGGSLQSTKSISVTIGTGGYFSLDGCHWVDASTMYVCADRNAAQAGLPDRVLVVNPADGSITAAYAAPAAVEDVTVKGSDVFVTMDDEYHQSKTGGNRVVRIPLADNRDFGMSWWMKTSGVDATEAVWALGDPVGESAAQDDEERGIGAYILSDDTTLRFFIADGFGSGTKVTHDFTGLSFTAWKHYAISIDASAQTLTLYIDGVQEGAAVDVSGLDLSYIYWRHRLSVGYQVDTALARFCDVDVADVALFDETISSAEAGELEAGPEPQNTDPGTIAGTETEGETLTATAGIWNDYGDGSASSSWTWERSDNGTTGWAAISGATASTYVLQAADVTKYVRAVERRTNTGGFDAAEDTPTAPTGVIASSDGGPVEPPTTAASWWALATDPSLAARYDGDGDADGMPDASDTVQGSPGEWINTAGYAAGPFTLGNAFATNGASFVRLGVRDDWPSGAASRTICCWFRADQVTANRGLLGYAAGLAGRGLSLGVAAGELEVDFGGHVIRTVGAQIAEDEWTHVAIVIPDGAEASGAARLYVDGSERAVATASGAEVTLDTATPDARIGATVDEADVFAGAVWDVRVYARALWPSELAEEASGPEPAPMGFAELLYRSGVLHWDGSNGSRAVEWDSFGNGAVVTTSTVRRSGLPLNGPILSGPDGASFEVTSGLPGVFDVVLAASNLGGADPEKAIVSNAVAFPPRPDRSAPPSVAGAVRVAGAVAGTVAVGGVDFL
ncbi:LamG-like jellyroll fold domain-containing protein [Botrimarina sp.]|uniref:LamG-like jellyroll fold domain-containing protein n=1 Tax=Botrimarina sp. TaxID=2795802 RepID=UPI0032EED6CB